MHVDVAKGEKMQCTYYIRYVLIKCNADHPTRKYMYKCTKIHAKQQWRNCMNAIPHETYQISSI